MVSKALKKYKNKPPTNLPSGERLKEWPFNIEANVSWRPVLAKYRPLVTKQVQ